MKACESFAAVALVIGVLSWPTADVPLGPLRSCNESTRHLLRKSFAAVAAVA